LLIMMEDSYWQTDQLEKACRIMNLIETRSTETVSNLELSEEIKNADLCAIQERSQACDEIAPALSEFLQCYHSQALSVKKAQTLNAILPGAGYYYVGQKNAAFTSFVINS